MTKAALYESQLRKGISDLDPTEWKPSFLSFFLPTYSSSFLHQSEYPLKPVRAAQLFIPPNGGTTCPRAGAGCAAKTLYVAMEW